MLTLTMRPYGGEADLQPIADMLNACEQVDQLEQWLSVAQLRQEIEAPSVDRTRDICLWEVNGQMVGFGQLWISETGDVVDGWLWFRVHPSARGRNLEKQIISWAQARMREVDQERGLPIKLRTQAHDHQTSQIALLENYGFTADRYFFTMERSLKEFLPEPQFPAEFTIRKVEGERDTEAWVEMYNQSFIDHWNHHPLTVEKLHHYLRDPNHCPELDWVAIAADGTFAAFCYCYINTEKNSQYGRNEGWVETLGTRRGFRKMGLGRAMLLSGMHQLRAAGMETAKLSVDADNPNGALKLYESVGFRTLHTRISFAKEL